MIPLNQLRFFLLTDQAQLFWKSLLLFIPLLRNTPTGLTFQFQHKFSRRSSKRVPSTNLLGIKFKREPAQLRLKRILIWLQWCWSHQGNWVTWCEFRQRRNTLWTTLGTLTTRSDKCKHKSDSWLKLFLTRIFHQQNVQRTNLGIKRSQITFTRRSKWSRLLSIHIVGPRPYPLSE